MNKFDRHIKNSLDNLEINPPNDLWPNISDKLDQHDHRRRFLWLFIIAILLLVIGGITYFLSSYSSESNTNATNTSTPVVPSDSSAHKNFVEKLPIASSAIDSSKFSIDKIPAMVDNPSVDSNSNSTSKQTNIANAKRIDFSSTENNTMTSESNPTLSNIEPATTSSYQAQPDKQIANQIISSNSSTFGTPVASLQEATFDDNISLESKPEIFIDSSYLNETTSPRDTLIAYSSIKEIDHDTIVPTDSLVDNTSSKKWFIETEAAIVLASASPTMNTDLAGYTYKNSISWTSRITAGFYISDKLTISSGLDYLMLKQKTSNVYASNFIAVEDDIFSPIFTILPSDDLWMIQDGFLPTENYTQGNVDLQASYIGVPLDLSYQIFKAKKVSIRLGAGATYYKLLKHTGTFTSEVSTFEINSANTTLNNRALMWSASADFNYDLSPRTQLFSTFDWKLSNQLYTTESAQLFSSGLGLRLHF